MNATAEVGHELLGSPRAKKQFPLLRFGGVCKRRETAQSPGHEEKTRLQKSAPRGPPAAASP